MAFLKLLIDIGMVFGPIIGYVDQYFTVKKTNSSKGFSLAVSGILLFSNIIRIFYWVIERFETALLFQAIVMSIMQILLLNICLSVSISNEFPIDNPYRHFSLMFVFDKKYWTKFWSWTSFNAYMVVISWLCIVVFVLNIIFGHTSAYSSILGSLALGIEATLGIPQLLKIREQRSSKGFSKTLLLTWVLGDSFKTAYYLGNHSPLPFIYCGCFQLFIDFLIILLCVHYWNTQQYTITGEHTQEQQPFIGSEED